MTLTTFDSRFNSSMVSYHSMVLTYWNNNSHVHRSTRYKQNLIDRY